MKSFTHMALISSSLFTLGVATQAQADLVVPTLLQVDNRQAAIYYCNDYADAAIEQFAKSQSLGCGFSGLRWNNDRQGQFNWCLTAPETVSLNERNFRDDALKTCQAKVESDGNQYNEVPVPQVCKDPSKAYTAVRQINNYFRYDSTVSSPVQNGLISYDYNRDRKPDYVFLETRASKARVAMCFSQGQRYRRQLTDIEFYTDGAGLGSTEYDISQQGDTLVVAINAFEHNAGSSYRRVTYRYDTAIAKFRIINNVNNETPVIYDGQPYPLASPATPGLF